MKFFTHFSVVGFSNSYLIGPDKGGDAVLIDPGMFDVKLLHLIESNNLYVKYILITHAHIAHFQGIKTILKIYEAQIFSHRDSIMDIPSVKVGEMDRIKVGEFEFDVYETPGHSSDSLLYVLNKFLFTGDTLTAGSIGSTDNGYAKGLMLSSIRKKILTFDDSYFIFPGHGPPTTIGIERRTNPYLQDKL